jgi:hypothetical protein
MTANRADEVTFTAIVRDIEEAVGEDTVSRIE